MSPPGRGRGGSVKVSGESPRIQQLIVCSCFEPPRPPGTPPKEGRALSLTQLLATKNDRLSPSDRLNLYSICLQCSGPTTNSLLLPPFAGAASAQTAARPPPSHTQHYRGQPSPRSATDSPQIKPITKLFLAGCILTLYASPPCPTRLYPHPIPPPRP